MIVWLTGLPCSGKTTIAKALVESLRENSYKTQLLDGDIVRQKLWRELGFSSDDRKENIKRFGILAQTFSAHNIITVVAVVSPYRIDRDEVRQDSVEFIEVFIDAPLRVCEKRDVKGMYAKAHAGDLLNFTGVDAPYEAPLFPEITCHTAKELIFESVEKIMNYLHETKHIIMMDKNKLGNGAQKTGI